MAYQENYEVESNSDSEESAYGHEEKDEEFRYMAGQVYHSLKETIITRVFEKRPAEIHIYEFDQMEETFKNGSSHYLTEEETSQAKARWEDLKNTLGWTEEDRSSYDYLEQLEYGFIERRLTADELQAALNHGMNIKYGFSKDDAAILKRFIDMFRIIQ